MERLEVQMRGLEGDNVQQRNLLIETGQIADELRSEVEALGAERGEGRPDGRGGFQLWLRVLAQQMPTQQSPRPLSRSFTAMSSLLARSCHV